MQTKTTTNLSPDEINKFSADMETWWDIFGEYAPLHAINPLRLNFIKQHRALASAQILDIGCGGGILTESLAQTGADIIGIDLNTEALQAAQQHAELQKLNIHYEKCSAENYAEKHPQKFDIVTCMEMLEHVPDPQSIIHACAQLVKPNGKVFLSTLNRNLKSYLFSVIGAEYILKLLPKGTHDYKKFIKPHELTALCRDANLNLIATSGISYQPLTRKYSLTRDLSVNYLMAFEKI